MISETARAEWSAAKKRLRDEPWFRAGWTIRALGEGGLQLSKAGWFNEDGEGIHFETWSTPEDLAQGALPFQCHVMHAGGVFPGTTAKAAALARPVLARCGDTIRAWGYHVPRAPGMTLLSARVPIASEREIAEVVARECARFATIGPTIDEMLAHVLAGTRPPRIATPRQRKEPKTPVIFGDSVLPPIDRVDAPASRWTTSTEAKGEIAVAPHGGGAKVVIGPKSRHGYHAVLRCGGLPIVKGHTYRVSFEARAESAYRIAGGIRQTHKPFLTVGFFPGLTIGTEWRTHTWDFVGERDEADASIVFALGKCPNTVWLRKLSLSPAVAR